MIATSDNFTKDDFLNDLYLFYRYFVSSGYPNSVPAPHIEELSRRLLSLYLGQGKSRLAVSMPPRHPIEDNTPVKTSKGWKTHGELKVGDYVYNTRHQKVKVIDVMPKTTVDNCFVFSNGDKIISGNEHLWKFHDYNNNTTRLFTTQEIMNRETFVNKSYLANFKIPVNNNKLISLIDKYKVPPSSGNCISVDSNDGMYLVGKNNTPTHNSKSSMVTLAFPLWLIFKDPSLNILIVNNSASLSEKFGIQIREYIKNIGPYFGVFLSDVKRSSTHIMFTDKNGNLYDGSIRLVGASGSITGQDADWLVIDDPYFGFDDISPSQLNKKIEWFQTIILQRLEPTSKLIILHTRWHPISKECPVLTTEGWTTHGELKEGDYVFTPNGKPTKVVKVHPTVKVDNCFEFANGDKIISGDHHLWNVYDWGNRKQRLMETHEIMQRQTLIGKHKRSNFLVEPPKPLEYPEKEVPIDPYWLGLWLGDGHHKRPSISIESGDEIATESTDYKVVRYDKGRGKCVDAFYTHQGILGKLKELNLYGNKHIPEIYLHNSYEVRMQLLAGLIDSDGSVEKSSNRVIFVNTNKRLLKQVYELLTSLSFNVHVEERPCEMLNELKKNNNSSDIISRKDAYALRFTPHLPIPTKIPRKANGKGVALKIGLIDKYKVEPVDGNCITVESEDGMYLVGRNLTPTHNSNDLIGHVRETDPDNYDFVEFPALDENDNPLWEERFDTDFLLDLKKNVGERVFQSVYQQKPIDATSDFFNMKKLKFGFPEDYVQESIARAWDIASGDQLSSNDFTAGVKMARFGDYAVILDLVHGRFGSNTKAMIQNTAFMDSPQCHVVIETGVAGAGELLYQEWSKQLQGFMVERAKVSGGKSKVDRATPFQNAIEDGKVYVAIEDGPTRQAFFDELNGFPAGEHDDITDACSHVYNYLFMNDSDKPVTAKFGVVYL